MRHILSFLIQRCPAALAPALFVLLLSACGGAVDLMSAVPESEANEVLGVLLDAGIHAEKVPGKEGMVSVRVSGSEVSRSLDILKTRGLPRERFAGMGEVFKKEGLISSPLEERARYLYALSQELGNTITHIDGVMVARVHVVLPERGSAGDPNTPSSAAVFIKYQDGYNLDTVQPQIKRLVTNSIPGLTTDKVSVILVLAQGKPGAPSAMATAAGAAKSADVLGMRMDADSTSTLWSILGTLTVLLLGALGGAGYLVWRHVLPKARKPKGRPSLPVKAEPVLEPVAEEPS